MATALLHNICMNNNIPMVNFDDNINGNDIDDEGDDEEVNADESDGITERQYLIENVFDNY